MFAEILPPLTTELNEDRLRRALLSGWSATKSYLDEFEKNDGIALDIAVTLRRTTRLILKHPTGTQERDALFDQLLDYLVGLAPATVEPVARAIEIIRFSEDGYHGILSLFESSAAASLTPTARVWLALTGCADTFDLIGEEQQRLQSSGVEVVTHSGPALDVLGDVAIVADDVNDAFVVTTTSIMLMAAISAGWCDESGYIVLPMRDVPQETNKLALDEDRLLAASWAKWRLFEEGLRYLGGDLVLLQHDDFDEVRLVQDERLHGVAAYMYLANERLRAKFFSRYQFLKDSRIVNTTDRQDAELPPRAYLSYREAASLQLLSEMFSTEFSNDASSYGGLRVVEWLRAYSILQALAEENVKALGRGGLTQGRTREEVRDALVYGGLTPSSADAAIKVFTLRRDSVDLFDAPIVLLANGQLMLFGPALISTSPVQTLASVFRTQGYDFKEKGAIFENAVRDLFNKHGIPAQRICEVIDGKTYECEVVARWSDTTLAIECKNKSLPTSSRAQMYFFIRQIDEDVEQVKRFVGFVNGHRELWEGEVSHTMGEGLVLPCIAASNLFWHPPIDGVHFCDSSMLHRFFEERHIFINKTLELDDNVKVLHRVVVDTIWEGDEPAPSDFMRYTADPPQIRGLLPTVTVVETPFPIGRFIAVLPFFAVKNVTMQDTLSAFPVTEQTVREEFEKVEKSLRKLAADEEPSDRPAGGSGEAETGSRPKYRLTIYGSTKDEQAGKN